MKRTKNYNKHTIDIYVRRNRRRSKYRLTKNSNIASLFLLYIYCRGTCSFVSVRVLKQEINHYTVPHKKKVKHLLTFIGIYLYLLFLF